VLAAGGYPNDYEQGQLISGLPMGDGDGSKVFHAGTAERDDGIVTAGGRVLCVVGLGDSVAEARDVAYAEAARITFKDAFCRKDIGYRAIAREQEAARC